MTILTSDYMNELRMKLHKEGKSDWTMIIESIDSESFLYKANMLGVTILESIDETNRTVHLRGYKLAIMDGKGLFASFPIKSIKFIGVDTSNCENMEEMFYFNRSLEEVDVSCFDTRKVKTMSKMFRRCEVLKKLDLSNFSIAKCKNLSEMFSFCCELESLDISSFNTEKVKKMGHFLFECDSLKYLNIGCLDMRKANDVNCIVDAIASTY